ncbi:TadE family type IV pilus minor pilin [uncultured Jatrophihabitans sp.]|uniref:TadE family type IV pilus minor pilin n=1 Tax=uncultured Jatrophihabitans sp. TaxID=1610747 RepID=UPI0035C9DD73
MATAELAACLPVLLLVLAVAVSAVSAVDARARAQDAAREAARAAGRGDVAAARRLGAAAAPGARLQLTVAGGYAVAVVRSSVRPLGGIVPAMSFAERAVAAVEPRAGAP